jgi:hypothetical protein
MRTWVDSFLLWDGVVVGLLTATDWLIGKTKRAQLRERVGDMWLRLEYTPYRGLASRHAAQLRSWMQSHLGEKCLSARFALTTASLSIPVFFVTAIINLWRADRWCPEVEASMACAEVAAQGPLFIAVFTIPVALCTWLSWSIAIKCLTRMGRNTSVINLVSLACMELVGVALVVAPLRLTMIWFVAETAAAIDFFMFGASALRNVFMGVTPKEALDDTIYVVALTAALPLLLHVLLIIMFVASKLVMPILKPPVQLVLLRFYESEVGVLTQLSIFVGALLKFVQEIYK